MKNQIESNLGRLASKTARVGTFSVLALLGAALAGGCSMETAQESEVLGEINPELGELRCAEQACIASNSCTALFAPYRSDRKIFTTATDGVPYGTFGCPQASTVAITADVGVTVRPHIAWGDVPLTEATCPSGKLDLTVYKRASSTAAWESTIYRLHGVWSTSVCGFQLNEGYPAILGITKTSTNEIRLAGSAKVGSTGYRTVTLGVTTGTAR